LMLKTPARLPAEPADQPLGGPLSSSRIVARRKRLVIRRRHPLSSRSICCENAAQPVVRVAVAMSLISRRFILL
jgi:hypothetical protein